MKSAMVKWTLVAVTVIGVVIGCSTAFNSGDEPSVDTSGGFSRVESEFTTAPQSPGGLGGGIIPDDDDVVIIENVPQVGEVTRSFFTAYQIDPVAEDTAGPKFVTYGDIDQDGLIDLVSAWNQSQPIQLHIQRRDNNNNISFRTITIAGTTPVAVVAGVQLGQINDDGFLDIVVLAKATGFATLCPPPAPGQPPTPLGATDGEIIIYFNPGVGSLIADGDSWDEITLSNPLVQDPWIHDQFPGVEEVEYEEAKVKPEYNGFTSLQVADIDGVQGDDIIVALNPAECEQLGQLPPINTVDLWINPGADIAEDPDLWGIPIVTDDNPNARVPIALLLDAPQVKDIKVTDVDRDGDLDVIATYTNATSLNLRWSRNPLIPHDAGTPGGVSQVIAGSSDGWRYSATEWERRPIGQVDTASDIIALGDIDDDGYEDIVVRSTTGKIVQWFRHPNPLSVQPEFPPNDEVPSRFNFPWPVYTLTEFAAQEPEAIAVGDITNDGKLDVLVAAEGGVFWYDGTVSTSVYDPWFPNTIIEGVPPVSTDPTAAAAPGAGVGVEMVDTSTHINCLLIVDLDDDGRNDVVGTLDRRTGAGLSDDRLVWYRNIRTMENP